MGASFYNRSVLFEITESQIYLSREKLWLDGFSQSECCHDLRYVHASFGGQ